MSENETTDPYAIARARLANGRHIGDAVVVALCDEIERLREQVKEMVAQRTRDMMAGRLKV